MADASSLAPPTLPLRFFVLRDAVDGGVTGGTIAAGGGFRIPWMITSSTSTSSGRGRFSTLRLRRRRQGACDGFRTSSNSSGLGKFSRLPRRRRGGTGAGAGGGGGDGGAACCCSGTASTVHLLLLVAGPTVFCRVLSSSTSAILSTLLLRSRGGDPWRRSTNVSTGMVFTVRCGCTSQGRSGRRARYRSASSRNRHAASGDARAHTPSLPSRSSGYELVLFIRRIPLPPACCCCWTPPG
jgi:hypothetical protein